MPGLAASTPRMNDVCKKGTANRTPILAFYRTSHLPYDGIFLERLIDA
jgi:hypothetical protein